LHSEPIISQVIWDRKLISIYESKNQTIRS